MSTLSPLILQLLGKRTGQNPMPAPDITRAVLAERPETTPDEVPDALEALIDQRQLATCRVTRGKVAYDVYWPTGLKVFTPPTLEQIRMSSEPKNSQLARLILKHGPISGTDLAAKATAAGLNCPTKNIQGILAAHITRGEIILQKRAGLNWYMTPNQAADVEAQAAGDEAGTNQTDEAEAHAMSAPPASAKQSGSEIQVNETASEEVAELKARIHGLLNDVAAANLIFSQMQETLRVGRAEDIPAALDEIVQAAAERVMQATQPAGPMALLLIDSADLIQIEALDPYDAPNAQQLAIRNIEHGNAARAMVVSIIGEAKRNVEWKAA